MEQSREGAREFNSHFCAEKASVKPDREQKWVLRRQVPSVSPPSDPLLTSRLCSHTFPRDHGLKSLQSSCVTDSADDAQYKHAHLFISLPARKHFLSFLGMLSFICVFLVEQVRNKSDREWCRQHGVSQVSRRSLRASVQRCHCAPAANTQRQLTARRKMLASAPCVAAVAPDGRLNILQQMWAARVVAVCTFSCVSPTL